MNVVVVVGTVDLWKSLFPPPGTGVAAIPARLHRMQSLRSKRIGNQQKTSDMGLRCPGASSHSANNPATSLTPIFSAALRCVILPSKT